MRYDAQNNLVIDVIGELKEQHKVYVDIPFYFKKSEYVKLPTGAIVTCILLHAAMRAEKEGISWSHTGKALREIFKLPPAGKMGQWLQLLEQQKVLTSTASGSDREWSPQWHMGSENTPVRVIRTHTGGANTRILQSPCNPNTVRELGFMEDSELKNSVGYTLISYNYGVFTGDADDLDLKVYHANDLNEVPLRATWLAINEVKVLPHNLELTGTNFWEVATPKFLAEASKMAKSSPTPLWRSFPENFWGKMDPVKRAKMFNEQCAKINPEAVAADIEFTQAWVPVVATRPAPVVIKPEIGSLGTPPPRVRNEATAAEIAKYRAENGHGPMVGNPFEREYTAQRRNSEIVAPRELRNEKRTPLVIKSTQDARKVWGGESVRTYPQRHATNAPKVATPNKTSMPERVTAQRTVMQTPAAPTRPQTTGMQAKPVATVATPERTEITSLTLVNDIVRSNLPKETQKYMIDMLILYGRFDLFPDKFKRNSAE